MLRLAKYLMHREKSRKPRIPDGDGPGCTPIAGIASLTFRGYFR
jgi:hypothetical protein